MRYEQGGPMAGNSAHALSCESEALDDDEQSARRLLIVDPWQSNRLTTELGALGFEIHSVRSLECALERLRVAPAARMVTELKLGSHTGFDLIRQVRAEYPSVKVVVLTAFASVGAALSSIRLGAQDVLSKPASAAMVMSAFGDTQPACTQAHWLTLEGAAHDYIHELLASSSSVSAAARALGVDRRSLRRMIARHRNAPRPLRAVAPQRPAV
jgi:two-component system response regulator RegA